MLAWRAVWTGDHYVLTRELEVPSLDLDFWSLIPLKETL